MTLQNQWKIGRCIDAMIGGLQSTVSDKGLLFMSSESDREPRATESTRGIERYAAAQAISGRMRKG